MSGWAAGPVQGPLHSKYTLGSYIWDGRWGRACRELSGLSRLDVPHTGLRRGLWPDSDHLPDTLSVGTPLFPYGIAWMMQKVE